MIKETALFPQQVYQIANDIRDMKIRGAGRIAKAAAEALKIAAESYKGEDLEDFKRYIKEAAKFLTSTRPTAVSLPNAVSWVLKALNTNVNTLQAAREAVINQANSFIQYADQALRKIAGYGEKMLRDGDTVLTHCNSLAAISVIVEAHKKGKKLHVFATETRPMYQGYITSEMLLKEGVNVTLIPESSVRQIIRKVDRVIVGADTVAANGAVVNKIGTSLIALAAHERSVDFFVATETFKFSPYTLIGDIVPIEFRPPSEIVGVDFLKSHPNLRILNPAFDVTPPDYITGIITELGIIPPKAAAIIIEEMYGRPVISSEILGRVEEDIS
ncbi:MAG: ribose 1,5-bisphosphate isomerase [Thermofilum sp.]|nr:ribose 1,5-bisphosphate isomerase [Thermofilum sp.]